MTGKCERHSASFEAEVALEAANQTGTIAELAETFQVHPVRISHWKKRLLDGAASRFRDGRRREHEKGQALQGRTPRADWPAQHAKGRTRGRLESAAIGG